PRRAAGPTAPSRPFTSPGCTSVATSEREERMSEAEQRLDVAIMMGSKSDLETMKPAAKTLEALGLVVEVRVLSAHRTPEEAAAFVKDAVKRGAKAFIAGAGGAAHLAGAVAAHTTRPVIGVPIAAGTL